MAAFSPLVGPAAIPQNLRTRSGIIEIDRRLAGKDGLAGNTFDIEKVKTMLFWNRNLAADLYLDDALKVCGASPTATTAAGKTIDIKAACDVLAKWDRRMDNESVGAHVFVEFWRLAQKIPNLYVTPFDPADPVHTPRGLKSDSETAAKLLAAMAGAVEVLDSQKTPLDSPHSTAPRACCSRSQAGTWG